MPASDETAARCLEAKALIGEAERLMRSNSAPLVRLSQLSGVAYDTLCFIRKGKTRHPAVRTLQKLRGAVARLREGSAK